MKRAPLHQESSGTIQPSRNKATKRRKLPLTRTPSSLSQAVMSGDDSVPVPKSDEKVPLLLAEGLCAVYKPLEWTSQDVVGKIRSMLEKDARQRGAKPGKRGRKGSVKVGHGGTLDPLATGVLVIGIGKGTKQLQRYLDGSKKYAAGAKLGFETTTLDMEGNVTNTGPTDGISNESIEAILPKFRGEIQQVPPAFSAIKRDGKKMYELARKGKTAEDLDIPPRTVHIHNLEYCPQDDSGQPLPCFGLDVECGGGTYIRSLIRDIGNELGTFATMTSLVRTKQGQFTIDMAIPQDEWTVENINAALERSKEVLRDESSS